MPAEPGQQDRLHEAQHRQHQADQQHFTQQRAIGGLVAFVGVHVDLVEAVGDAAGGVFRRQDGTDGDKKRAVGGGGKAEERICQEKRVVAAGGEDFPGGIGDLEAGLEAIFAGRAAEAGGFEFGGE